MTLVVATWLVNLALAWTAAGLVFAVPFVLRGAARIDPDAARGTWGFRVLILPGCVALWPLLLVRWMRAPREAGAPPAERSPHRDAAEAAR